MGGITHHSLPAGTNDAGKPVSVTAWAETHDGMNDHDHSAATTQGGSTVAAAALSSSGTFGLTGVVSDTISATKNNYAPTGYASATVFLLTPSGDRYITGLAGGVAGRVVLFVNTANASNSSLYLSNDSASSTAANRFYCAEGPTLVGGNLKLGPSDIALLVYDATASRWRVAVIGIGSPNLNQVAAIGAVLGMNVADVKKLAGSNASGAQAYIQLDSNVEDATLAGAQDSGGMGIAKLQMTKATTTQHGRAVVLTDNSTGAIGQGLGSDNAGHAVWKDPAYSSLLMARVR